MAVAWSLAIVSPFFRRVLALCGIAIFGLLLQWSDRAQRIIEPVEHVLYDHVRRFLAVDKADDRILIVDIDEESLARVGPWPWPRFLIADLIERLLVDYDAKSVGLDIIFPSRSEDRHGGDKRLAALGEHWPVVFAQAFDFALREQPLQTGVPLLHGTTNLLELAGPPRAATGFVANHEGLSMVRCVGNIGIRPDDDGRIRQVPLVVEWQGLKNLLLPLEMLRCSAQSAQSVPERSAPPMSPALDAASWKVPFDRKWEAYTVTSASDILAGNAPAELLRGRWVLIGSSALGLNDRASTPLSATAAGVMVHAAVLSSLLDWKESQLSVWRVEGRWLASAWTLATLALLAWLMSNYRAWIVIPAVIAMVLLWLTLAMWWLQHQLQFSIAAPLLAYAVVMLMIPLEWWLNQREQSNILKLFASYVAPTVLDQILREGIDQPLVPKYTNITVLSADMENYTGHTRQSSLSEAARLTREFLQCLTEPVLRLEGTLDKYTGDGLVAFWGAPIQCEDHTTRAIEAGRQVVNHVKQWNEGRAQRGQPPVRVRVGIETGSVLVGDLGTAFRSTYTAVGNCINLASKMQAAARDKPTDLVIGPAAASAASRIRADIVPLCMETLPGATGPVMLWTIRELLTSSIDERTRDQVAPASPT